MRSTASVKAFTSEITITSRSRSQHGDCGRAGSEAKAFIGSGLRQLAGAGDIPNVSPQSVLADNPACDADDVPIVVALYREQRASCGAHDAAGITTGHRRASVAGRARR